jgi:tRNA 2-thiouridine synthesizing protein C
VNKKKLLFIIRHCPYGNLLARESLDAVLATSAYEQTLSVLFLDDGVFQLLAQQITEPTVQKNISKLLSAFSVYEINAVSVCQSSLYQRGLDETDLCIAARLLDLNEVQMLIQKQDQLLSF